MKMTRKDYMNKLQSSLCFLLPEREIADILQDMEECFDAGAAEGRTEEQVCADLGDPKAAARDIVSNRRGIPNPARSAAVPYAVCTLLGAAYFLYMYSDMPIRGAVTGTVAMLLPLLIWFILERKNFFKGVLAARADGLALAGAAAAFLSAPLFSMLANGIFFCKPNEVLLFSYGTAVLIIGACVLLTVSVLKSSLPKFLCVFPAAIAGMMLVTLFLSVNRIYMLSDEVRQLLQNRTEDGFVADFAPELQYYFGTYGQTLSLYIDIIIITDFVCFLWGIVNKNAFSVSMLYLAVSGGCYALDIRYSLSRMDPATPPYLIKFTDGPQIYAIAAVLVLVAVCAARIIAGKKEKAADNSSKDGDC